MTKKIDPEVRARAVRLVADHLGEYPSLTAASAAVAKQVGVGHETVRRWVLQSQVDGGLRGGATTEELAEIRKLKAVVDSREPAARWGRRYSVRGDDFLRGGTRPPQPLMAGFHRDDEG